MLSRSALLPVVALALLAPASAAGAATATLDKPCYVEGAPMVLNASGFANGSTITASGNGVFASTGGPTNGSINPTALAAPIQPGIGPTDISNNVLNVSDGTQTVPISYQLVNFAASAGTSIRSPKKKRAWNFSGFPVGSTIYAHFRRGGKTVSNYKFGVAAAPCGTLSKKAPLLPKVKKIKSGTYGVQIDGAPKYNAATRPAFLSKVRVFKTFR